MTRLNEDTPAPIERPNRLFRYRRTCIECGDEFKTDKFEAEFCCTTHRQTFNNRRMQRGGELYDLLMAWRYDRTAAHSAKAMTMFCRMARQFREEDTKEREGRHSWRKPRRVMARHPHLYAVATNINPRKRR